MLAIPAVATAVPAAPAAAWPALREELQLHAAGANPDGSPAWHIADPVRNHFVRIGWLEFEMLQRWGLSDARAIAAAIRAETTLAAAPYNVEAFVLFLREQSLLRQVEPRASLHRFGWNWLLHNYLFMRIPLVRPARFLGWLAPRLSWLYTPRFLALTLLAGLSGVMLAARQWDVVTTSLQRAFTWEGTLGFLGALALSKLLHELSHAVTATRHGVRVGHMGVALVVMWPMAYTDTGESWKLASPQHRLAIASAGILAELALAAWCTLLWVFLPDGGLRAAVFFLATTAWVWTLAINVSPFMRFDGYFILSDWLDFPGLHHRATQWAKRWLRRALFGLEEAEPENIPRHYQRALIAFSVATWLYRVVVFFGIALLVYHAFFKLLGIVLFAVEIWFFVARPVFYEMKHWWRRRDEVAVNVKRLWAVLALCGMVAVLLPWPGRVSAPGVLRAAVEQTVYSPYAARLERLDLVEGEKVAAGTVVAELFAPRHAGERNKAAAAAEGYGRAASGALALEGDGAARQVMAESRRVRWSAEINARDAELARLHVAAEESGEIHDLNPQLARGSWVNAATPIAWVVQPGSWRVEALVGEEDRLRLQEGGRATVVVHGRTQVLSGRIVAIDNTRVLRLPHMLLAKTHGGPFSVVPGEAGGALRPTDAVYRVLIEGDGDRDRPAVRLVGVHLEAKRESAARRWFANGVSILIQQAGF